MDLELLRTFLEIYRTRHFRRAANNLHISQSTVSARLRQLEETIGVTLFTRERNNIQTTPAGQRLVPHAEHLLTQWSRTRQELAADRAQDTLLITGATGSLWDTVLQSWLQRVYREERQIALRVESHSQETVLRSLEDGLLDLAFTYDTPLLPHLQSIKVAKLSLRMFSTEPDRTVQQIMHTGYILVDWGTSFAKHHAREFASHPLPRCYFSNGRNALDLILSCGGAAYLPEPLVAEQIEHGRLFAVTDAKPVSREIFASYPEDHPARELLARIVPRSVSERTADRDKNTRE